MRAIQKSQSHEVRCIPNILPCRINRNGPVNTSKRYWNPTKTADGRTIAYFRGRKLHSRQLNVPASYKGIVLSASEDTVPKKATATGDVEEDEEEEPEVKIMREQSIFDQIMVWGHEAVMDESDPYVRSLEEWMGLAEQIHTYDSNESAASKQTK